LLQDADLAICRRWKSRRLLRPYSGVPMGLGGGDFDGRRGEKREGRVEVGGGVEGMEELSCKWFEENWMFREDRRGLDELEE
jgi:hypothetical protein